MSEKITLQDIENLGFNHDAPFHFFTSSCLGWETGDNLIKVLNRQKKADKGPHMSAARCALWIVPGTCKDTDYKIFNFAPQINGAVFIAMINY